MVAMNAPPALTCVRPLVETVRATPTVSQRLRLQLGAGGDLHFSEELLTVQPGLHLLVARSSQVRSPGPRPPMRCSMAIRCSLRARGDAFASRQPCCCGWAGADSVRLPTFLELFGDRASFGPTLELRPSPPWAFELAGGRAWTPSPI